MKNKLLKSTLLLCCLAIVSPTPASADSPNIELPISYLIGGAACLTACTAIGSLYKYIKAGNCQIETATVNTAPHDDTSRNEILINIPLEDICIVALIGYILTSTCKALFK